MLRISFLFTADVLCLVAVSIATGPLGAYCQFLVVQYISLALSLCFVLQCCHGYLAIITSPFLRLLVCFAKCTLLKSILLDKK